MAPRRSSSNSWYAPPGHDPAFDGPAWQALGKKYQADRDAEGDRPTADGTRFRGSMALDCERKIAYQALGVAPVASFTTETLVAFAVGQSYHDQIQASLVDAYGAQCEVTCSYRDLGGDVSGHADAVYEAAGRKVIVEIKSMKAYAFDLAVSGNKWDNYGPGPKREHVTQAAIYGLAPQIEADDLHMIYVCKDDGRLAEWVLPMHAALIHWGDTVTPAQLARAELDRFARIGESLDAKTMPARWIPGVGLVEGIPPRPDTSERPWNCRYCGWRDLCADAPANSHPIIAEW